MPALLGCLLLACPCPAAAQGVPPDAGTPTEATGPASEPLSGPTAEGHAAAETRSGVDQSLDEIEGLIRDAYFRTALGVAAKTRGWLDELAAQPALAPRRARLEVLAATAEVALEQRAQAVESMRRALAADPLLTLDEDLTSPKILALLQEARTGGTAASRP